MSVKPKNDIKDNEGNILLKANTTYFSKGEETINGKEYMVFDSEIETEEVLIEFK